MSTVHYYDQLMTAAHASCRWLAAARFTEQGIIAGYRPARRPTDHAHCSLRAVNIQTPMIFTARRLAKRGICRRRVSVCVCVSVTLRYCITSGSAIAEGPRDVLVSINSATTKYRYRVALFT